MQQEPAHHQLGPREASLTPVQLGVQYARPLGISETVYDLSHEVRTSLAIVTLLCGNLDRLYERLEDDERRRIVQKLRKQMARLNKLVGDVLALADDGGALPL
jgi:signal transduction histidine kinase